MPTSKPRPWKRRTLSMVWIVLCIVSVVGYIPASAKMSWWVYAQVRPLQVLEDIGLVVVVLLVMGGLTSLHPVFTWWLGRLFKLKSDGTNINLMPIRVPILGPIYLFLLAFVLPVICYWEETIFRQGTHDWKDAIVRSLLFGFVHMLVGVPLGAAIALSVAGLWLSICYLQGGILLSTVHHTTYDLIILTILFLGLVLGEVSDRKHAVNAGEPED